MKSRNALTAYRTIEIKAVKITSRNALTAYGKNKSRLGKCDK